MKNIILSFMTSIFFVAVAVAPECRAASSGDGAALFRKHCSGCHPDPSRLRSVGDIVSFVRAPRPSMPAFNEEKLPERDAKAIADFLHSADPNTKKIPVPPAAPPASRAETAPASAAPAPFGIESDKPLTAIKLPKDGKSKIRSFVKKWTIKSLHNDELVTILRFEIAANAHNELLVIPDMKVADHAMDITTFEIINKTLRLQFKWKMKDAGSYWKVETLELIVSNDGKKLSGSYNLQTVGGTNMSWTVWGE